MNIGIIAEEKSDVDVIYELTCKLTDESDFSFKKFIGHGCGKLRRKCTVWAENLLLRGCNHLIVIHDLDKNNESKLRRELNNNVKDIGFKGYIILIPIKEIEAWLLTDSDALKNVFNMNNKPKLPGKPEWEDKPKERLREIVWKTCKKHYINTIHNKKIAAALRIDNVLKCKSFQTYPEFITKNIT